MVSTRPAIDLCELMTEEQLLKLIRLATDTSDAAWSSHAVSCLLMDLLEGKRDKLQFISFIKQVLPIDVIKCRNLFFEPEFYVSRLVDYRCDIKLKI